MKYKTEEKHFKLFQEECNKWIDFFGLKQWRVFYEHDGRRKPDSYGWVYTDHPGKVATIGLTVDWTKFDTEPKDYNIKRTAFHEVCELLISPLERLAKSRYGVLEEEIDEVSHAIIRTLENTIWAKDVRRD